MPQPKILIVDDANINIVAMTLLLKNVKATIITASSGEKALEIARNEDGLALILLDVEMPEMDGFEVSRAMQKETRTRSIPIIIITAHQDSAHIERAYLSGAVDFLQKPVRKTALLSKVRVFLDLWSLRSGLEQEIVQRKLAEQRVEHLAVHDPLTNLYNRRGLYEQLNQMISRSQRNHYSSVVIFIDLDGFKSINDEFGHESGDFLLKKISESYKKIVRQTDTIARIGGDEFVVLMTDISESNALIIKVEQFITATSAPVNLDGRIASVSASIGIALYPDHGSDTETLLDHADQAMYQAKSEGKNTFRFFSEDINRRANRKRELQENLKKSLPNNEFTVFYQPIVGVKTGTPVSAEALLRWQNATMGEVGPDEFIPAAESAGLISELGRWVLSEAVSSGAAWSNQYGIKLRLAINASSLQFKNNLLYDSILQQINQHDWSPDLLEIEITEGLLLSDSIEVTNYINAIDKLGVRLSIDDFGTGFSALSYLKNYPVSTVKIDRTFVIGLPEDKENVVLVGAIIAMAHGLGLEVIAEGVETLAQWEFLKTLNCDFAQGYYFGKPMPMADFENYLMDHLD